MNAAAQEAVIVGHCRELKMPSIVREHAAIARQARDGGWSYEDFLVQVLETEIHSRRGHAIEHRLRDARPTQTTKRTSSPPVGTGGQTSDIAARGFD